MADVEALEVNEAQAPAAEILLPDVIGEEPDREAVARGDPHFLVGGYLHDVAKGASLVAEPAAGSTAL